MNSEHITKILDETRFADLTEREISDINAHAENCSPCAAAWQAARVSHRLFADAATQVFAPTPFFETRILAALREKQTLAKPIAAFWRWWHASSAVVLPILLVVITLAALTIFAPKSQPIHATASDDFSTDTVIFQGNNLDQELTTAQAMQIIYEQRDSK